jgi:GTPase
LIEGAHTGAGLGHDFLRHIERTRLLLHLVDATSETAIADYQTIQQELTAYGRGLSDRPQILALNKIDAVDAEDLAAIVSQFQALTQATVFTISAVTRSGLETLLNQVWQSLDDLPPQDFDNVSMTSQKLLKSGSMQ